MPNSVVDEYIADPAAIPWRQSQVAGITFRCQILLSGADGGPEALRFQFDPCPSVFAHMHLTSQFQLLLHGRMNFPKSTMKLRAIAAHYTDHNFPYGPFAVAEDHDMLVLHPQQGGLISMADRDARRQINLAGRHLYGVAADTSWTASVEYPGARCKRLIAPPSGPSALMLEYRPREVVELPPAPHGRYEVVLAGTLLRGDRELAPPGLRYVKGEPAVPFAAGPAGATLMLLSFDQDARAGGLTGDGLAVAAAAAMERAI